MAYSNLLPKTKTFNGSDCTGSDATANRTYDLVTSGIIAGGMTCVINGTNAVQGSGYDYTLTGSVITFLNIIDDSDIIQVTYFIVNITSSSSTLTTSTSLKYSTPAMFAEMLDIKSEIPSWAAGTSPTKEEVGTGDNSETIFYLDQKSVLSDTYTLYYGSAETTTDELTEETHYTIDADSGKITLTSTGVTLLGTDKIYAEYSYINNGMKNSYLITVLSRAEKEVDKATNTTFTDGTTNNPAYPVTTEIQPNEGYFQSDFIVKKKPLIDVETTLAEALDDSETEIDLTDASGYPSSGYIIVDSEVIQYTGISSDTLTSCTRGALGTTAAEHSNGVQVHSTLFFRSNTSEGTDETFTIQPWDTSMYADESGLIYKFKDANPDNMIANFVANRIKIIYYYGNNTIPGDITRLTLLFAKRMLVQDSIGRAMIAGRNEFQPEMFNADLEEMRRIIGSHIVLSMGNT